MKKIILGIYFLEVFIIIMTLLEFIYLDKKITRTVEKQNEINISVSSALEEHAKHIRVLNTDCLVLTNILTSGEFVQRQNEGEE